MLSPEAIERIAKRLHDTRDTPERRPPSWRQDIHDLRRETPGQDAFVAHGLVMTDIVEEKTPRKRKHRKKDAAAAWLAEHHPEELDDFPVDY